DVANIADIFWIGGTKAGTLFGEAIVIPDDGAGGRFRPRATPGGPARDFLGDRSCSGRSIHRRAELDRSYRGHQRTEIWQDQGVVIGPDVSHGLCLVDNEQRPLRQALVTLPIVIADTVRSTDLLVPVRDEREVDTELFMERCLREQRRHRYPDQRSATRSQLPDE
ncbi:MAG: hypothetical protein ACI81L_002636, partial [Verrucomicrobiales bacterium]